MDAKARAQANDAMDDVVRTVKRHQRENRDLLATVRQAQAALLGIEIETSQPQLGGTDQHGYQDEDQAA